MNKKMCIPYEHMPKNVEISNFEQLLKHILRVFPSLGGKFNSVGLDHSGSQPFIFSCKYPLRYLLHVVFKNAVPAYFCESCIKK